MKYKKDMLIILLAVFLLGIIVQIARMNFISAIAENLGKFLTAAGGR